MILKPPSQSEIISLFDRIASKYDLINNVISLNMHSSWRRNAAIKTISILKNHEAISILDVATGTGDMLMVLEKEASKAGVSVKKLCGVDLSVQMLNLARKKQTNAEFMVADAANLPFKDCTFDLISISFGLRNVVQVERALQEFFRLLKDQGVLLILEFLPDNRTNIVNLASKFYLNFVLPFVGGLISGWKAEYKYLPESIKKFPDEVALEKLLLTKGFRSTNIHKYCFGTVSCVIGVR